MQEMLCFLPVRVLVVPRRNVLTANPVCPRRAARSRSLCALAGEPERKGAGVFQALRALRARRNDSPHRKFADMPAMLRGPEAVLGLALAAGVIAFELGRNLGAAAAKLRGKPFRKSSSLLGSNDASDSMTGRPLFLAENSDVLTALSGQLDIAKSELKQAEEKLDIALSRAKEAEASLKKNFEVRRKLNDVLSQQSDTELALSTVRFALSTEESCISDLKEEKNSLSDKLVNIERDVTRTRDEIRVEEKGFEDFSRSDSEIAGDLTNATSEVQDRIRAIDSEIETLRADNEGLESERRTLETEAQVLIDEVQEISKQLATAKEALDEQLANRAEVEASRASIASKHEQELVAAKSELESLRLEVGKKKDAESKEINALKSSLAAREVEILHLTTQLELKLQSEMPMGDPSQSELSLQEVNDDLQAEQLSKQSLIDKANILSESLQDSGIDPLDYVTREMHADENMLKANLKKAKTIVRAEEHARKRKAKDIQSVVSDSEKDEQLAVARQRAARRKPEDREARPLPKARRGRPRKLVNVDDGGVVERTSTSASSSAKLPDAGEVPVKRKRGRPRKNISDNGSSNSNSKGQAKRTGEEMSM